MNRTLSGDVQFENGEIGISQCVWCRHRSEGGQRCTAFPGGIPVAILRNRHDHRHAYDGDHGVRFEPEVVEIEFVDVDGEADSPAADTDFEIVTPGGGSSEPDAPAPEKPEEAEGGTPIVAMDTPVIETNDVVFDLDGATGR